MNQGLAVSSLGKFPTQFVFWPVDAVARFSAKPPLHSTAQTNACAHTFELLNLKPLSFAEDGAPYSPGPGSLLAFRIVQSRSVFGRASENFPALAGPPSTGS
eukprot:SAG31_NODE_672_length_12933_cov_3.746143_6_plen_102_part_00